MNPTNWLRLSLLFALFAGAGSATAEHPMTLFTRAIGEGTATGEITGEVATRWNSTTRSTLPIRMTATVVKRYRQEGCARLEVQLSQDGVPTKDGGKDRFQTGWQFNLCLDGSPPGTLEGDSATEGSTS